MGEPNVAIPCCGPTYHEQPSEPNGLFLKALRGSARSALVVAILFALVGSAAIVAQLAYDTVGLRGVAALLNSVGLAGGISLLLGDVALAIAAFLLVRSADYLIQARAVTGNAEDSSAALQRIEQRYRMLVQLMTTFFGTGDASGGIDTIQEGWQHYTGQSWKEQQGYGWIHAIHPDDRQRILHLWGEAVRLNCSIRVEYRLWHAASQEFHLCESAALPLCNGDGTVREWIAAVRDIDDQVGRVASSLQTESQPRWSTPIDASSPDAYFTDIGGPSAEKVGAEHTAGPSVLDREQD